MIANETTVSTRVQMTCITNYKPDTSDTYYLHYWVDATAGGRFVPEGITSPVVSTLKLT